jgi:hypothetical protein
MHKLLVILLTFTAISVSVNSQGEIKSKVPGQTSFYAEVGGPGILFSANYDRRFKPSNLGLGGRIGLGFVTAYSNSFDTINYYYYGGRQVSALTVPLQVNYIFGKGSSPHTFEVGAGITFVSKKLDIFNFYNNERSNLFGTFSFMYRRQPKDGGFTWRIGFTPLLADGYIQASAAAGVGFNF